MTSCGSSARLDLPDHVERRAVLAAHVRAELDPDAVVVVDDRAGVERGRHAVLPDPVVQGERVRAAVRNDEAAVDHRAPRIPVREVHPQLEPDVAVGLAHGAPQRLVHRLDAGVRGDDVERAPDRRQLGLVGRVVEVVAPVPPALPERRVEHLGARLARQLERPALLERGGLGLALERQHRVDAAEVLADDGRERQPRRLLVVEAHDRRAVAELQRAPDRADAGAHGRERDGGETALGGYRDELQRRPRDHAERALRADEQLRQLGAHRVPRHRDRVGQAAGRRRHAQRQHEILDLAVAGREHAGPAGGDVAADRRPLDRRGIVRQHQPAGVQLGLELAPVLAGLHGHGHRDLVDLDHLGERAQVDHDAAVHGERAALGAGAAAPRHHRHAVLVRDRQRRLRRPLRCVAVRPRPVAPMASRRPSRQCRPVGVRRVGVQRRPMPL